MGISTPDDKPCFRRDFCIDLRPVLDGLQQRGNVGHLSIRRRKYVGTQCLHAATGHIPLRIKEPRQHRAPGQIDPLCHRAGQRLDVRQRARRNDAPARHRHRLDPGGGVVHRQNCPAGIDDLNRIGRTGCQRNQRKDRRTGHRLGVHDKRSRSYACL